MSGYMYPGVDYIQDMCDKAIVEVALEMKSKNPNSMDIRVISMGDKMGDNMLNDVLSLDVTDIAHIPDDMLNQIKNLIYLKLMSKRLKNPCEDNNAQEEVLIFEGAGSVHLTPPELNKERRVIYSQDIHFMKY